MDENSDRNNEERAILSERGVIGLRDTHMRGDRDSEKGVSVCETGTFLFD